jgi:hypothetical protein
MEDAMWKRAFVLLVVLALCGCATAPTPPAARDEGPVLVGSWERVGSEDVFAGMRVRVEKADDGSMRAVIIALTDACTPYGFELRDVKWANIVQTGQDTYSLQDLSKPSMSWYDMILTFVAPDRMRLEDVVSQGEIGSSQVWARVVE